MVGKSPDRLKLPETILSLFPVLVSTIFFVVTPMSDSGESKETITVEDLENLVGELRMMARRLLVNEGRNHSFTPTALAMSALPALCRCHCTTL